MIVWERGGEISEGSERSDGVERSERWEIILRLWQLWLT